MNEKTTNLDFMSILGAIFIAMIFMSSVFGIGSFMFWLARGIGHP